MIIAPATSPAMPVVNRLLVALPPPPQFQPGLVVDTMPSLPADRAARSLRRCVWVLYLSTQGK
jgi:hypothetical protein